MERMLYWAYGSNLNVAAMRARCPAATKFTRLDVEGRLVFRGVLDVEVHRGGNIPGGLWWVTPECVRALDRYEGCRGDSDRHGLYVRRYLHLQVEGRRVPCLFYQMNVENRPGLRGVDPPSHYYLETVRQGYRDFNLPQATLDEAVARAHDQRRMTRALTRRAERRAKREASGLIKYGSEPAARSPLWHWGDDHAL
jgi:hypothetical protein